MVSNIYSLLKETGKRCTKMTSTPPPRGRLRTPPAPTHGPGYDAYSPYSGSPRRSKRLASKIESQHDQLEPQTPLSSDKNYQSGEKLFRRKLAHSLSTILTKRQDFHESPGSGSELQRTSLYSHHSLSASGESLPTKACFSFLFSC